MKPSSCDFTNISSRFDKMLDEPNYLFKQNFVGTPKESPNGELTYSLTLNGRCINIVSTPDSLSIEVDDECWAKKD